MVLVAIYSVVILALIISWKYGDTDNHTIAGIGNICNHLLSRSFQGISKAVSSLKIAVPGYVVRILTFF